MPQPLLPRIFADADLFVEMAFNGGDGIPTALWTWVDITDDVRQSSGIATQLGRSDEASVTQPATCTLVLDNVSGDYSPTPDSIWYPNIRQGVPLRVRVDPNNTGDIVIFQGTVSRWTPSWDMSGQADVTMAVEGSGVLRKLGQNQPPLFSVMRRVMSFAPSVVSYWPCEDGKAATYFAAGKGTSPITFNGFPKPASDTNFLCSAPLPQFGSATFVGNVDDYIVDPVENGQQVRALFTFPDGELTDQQVIMRINTSGTMARIDLRYNTGGAMDLKVYNSLNSLIFDGGAVAFGVKGSSRRISFEMFEDAGVVHFGVNHVIASGGGLAGSIPGDPNVAGTVGKIISVTINPNPDNASGSVAFGHVAVQNIRTQFTDLGDGLTAFDGELNLSVDGRMFRLGNENNIEFTILGASYETIVPTDFMGPQTVNTILGLLRECEAVDQGILFDGVNAGLTYVDRRHSENATPALVISASALKLAPPFGPIADDQRLVNSATITRSRGTSAEFVQTTGPLGTATAGISDSSGTINMWQDESALQYASLKVAKGTVIGYRYPQITVDLSATPELADEVIRVLPGSRVQITQVRSVLPGAPDDTVDVIVEGVSHRLDDKGWKAVLRCSPYVVHRVGTSASPTGDSSLILLRADTDGSVLAANAAAAATSISVTTVTSVTEGFESGSGRLTGGWQRTTAQHHSGTSSLRSGVIGDSAITDAVLNVAEISSIRFWYRVSSEATFDFFRLLLDGVESFNASGEVGWTQSALIDLSATNFVTFRYQKDSSAIGGEDAAYIDDLTMTLVGPRWTTLADDFPYDLDIGGRLVTVTACVDATSPQTMTVSPLSHALTAGAPVQLYNPHRLGL